MSDKKSDGVGVGMPAWLLLQQFGKLIRDVFGDYPYLVGSAAKSKQWRDVDVRLIIDDCVYETLFGKISDPSEHSRRWQGICLAFSVLGKQMTGLPIDFQIQAQSKANEMYDGPRHALILYDLE